MSQKELEAIMKIANIAWSGYSRSPECKQIYEICRDKLQVMAVDYAPTHGAR